MDDKTRRKPVRHARARITADEVRLLDLYGQFDRRVQRTLLKFLDGFARDTQRPAGRTWKGGA